MIVIDPHPISDAMFVASSVPEPDTSAGETTAHNMATTYALGATVYVAAMHKVYESLINSNIGHYPPDEIQGDADNPPTKWQELKSTNKWDILDYARNTTTITTSPYTFSLKPNKRFNSMALLGLEADAAIIEVVVDGQVKYSETVNLSTRVVNNWFNYFFAEFGRKSSLVRFNLPTWTQAQINITLLSNDGIVKLGAAILGTSEYIGDAQYGAVRDAINYSKITNSFDGKTQLLKRNSVPQITAKLFAPKSLSNKLLAIANKLNASPAVYVGVENSDDVFFESFLMLGVYTQFPIQAYGPNEIQIDLTIKEIIR